MKQLFLLSLLGASCSLLIDGIAAPVCTETRCDVTNELLLLQCESNEDNVGVINRVDCSTPDAGQTLCQDDLSIDGSAENTISGCTICGDGLLDLNSFEACDDGDDNNNNACIVQDAAGAPLCTIAICGDGFTFNDGGTEECDDGNADNTDACTNVCLAARCGDGFLQTGNGEFCDDGNAIETDGCNSSCF